MNGKCHPNVTSYVTWLINWEDIGTHLNRDKTDSNLSVPEIQGCHENALCKSFETSPYLICLYASTNIPLGPA